MDIKFDAKTVITSIIMVVSLVGGILAFDDRYVTAKEFNLAQQSTVQSLKQFGVEQERRFLTQRYQTLTDQMMKQKQLIKTYPNDKELKDDLIEINRERDEVKIKMDAAK